MINDLITVSSISNINMDNIVGKLKINHLFFIFTVSIFLIGT